MNESNKIPILVACFLTGLIGVIAIKQNPNSSSASAIATTSIETQSSGTEDSVPIQTTHQRILRLTITVDNPSFLKVKEGQEITAGEVITDNTLERERLNKQHKSIELQIKNLNSKEIPKPIVPSSPPASHPLPLANYAEEEAAIAQVQMRLAQAQSLLEARTPLLTADNPERRAEAEKAEAALRIAAQKFDEQQQMLQAMKDRQLQSEIIRHEEAKLKQIEEEQEQAKSVLEQARAKLNAAGIDQQQQLQQLQLAVGIAHSELELAKSRLSAAQSRRRLLEYDASIQQVERSHKEQELQQEYNRQQQSYAQAIRDRDYQLAQLQLSLSVIDDKLSQIPVVKSPRNGYIRRVKPWIGNNGKYSTTIIISSTPSTKSSSGSGGNASSPKSPGESGTNAPITSTSATR